MKARKLASPPTAKLRGFRQAESQFYDQAFMPSSRFSDWPVKPGFSQVNVVLDPA